MGRVSKCLSPIRANTRVRHGPCRWYLPQWVILSLSATTCGELTGGRVSGTVDYPNPDAGEAARFLSQATFGPTAAEIDRLRQLGYGAWLDEQFALPASPIHQTVVKTRSRPQEELLNSFWRQAATGQDQVRQRLAFSYSQIFVVSMISSAVNFYPLGVASYLDLLGASAYGTYRALLEGVTRHPMMGLYLSHLGNQKEDAEGYQVPDQNFAREIMQLFSIGLYELNPDGSIRLIAGDPIETYRTEDVVGLSRVFTGFSWAGTDKSKARFTQRLLAHKADEVVRPMEAYPQFHSVLEKHFLGVTIPPGQIDPDADLAVALDTLAAHPNVGPFIGRQLIQRLVTSNPSPAYVSRVSTAFDTGRYASGSWSTGTGARGDLQALAAAVLLDPEARARPDIGDTRTGRVREPVLRLANWMRAFNVRSSSGGFRIGRTDVGLAGLGQSPLYAPSVFNFYRPGYTPQNAAIADAGLVAPELQITDEASVLGYANFLYGAISSGVGISRDLKADYSAEIAIAHDPDLLIGRMNLLLTGNTLSTATLAMIRDAVVAIAMPTRNQTSARQRRVWTAALFTLSSPDYLVQK